MRNSEKGNLVLTAIPVLLGLAMILWGALLAETNLGYGLILIGLGIVCSGLGGSLTFGGLGVKVSGTLGGVIMAVGAVMSYLPRP